MKVRDDVLDHVVVALLAEGHILVEDYPGVGKTALARALSRTLDCQFARVQCTADLLPADIVGHERLQPARGALRVPARARSSPTSCSSTRSTAPRPRRSPACSSACRSATSPSTCTRTSSRAPFMVFATQNPVEYEGTYPLPEAQVDRFMVRLSIGYPSPEDEASMLAGHEGGDRVLELEPVVDRTEVLAAQDAARRVHASRALRDYIVALLRAHARGPARRAGRLARAPA